MNKKRVISSAIFNIAETMLIFMVGKLLYLPTNFILIVMLTFMISRGCFGKALHFKTWYRCLVWSLCILLSLFVILKIDLVLSILFTIFSALIMTGKGNIKDIYLWDNEKNKSSKYRDVEEYIKYNEFSDELQDFEQRLIKNDNLLYLIYKYRFKDNKTFKDISELLQMENPRIVDALDKISLAIRINCRF